MRYQFQFLPGLCQILPFVLEFFLPFPSSPISLPFEVEQEKEPEEEQEVVTYMREKSKRKKSTDKYEKKFNLFTPYISTSIEFDAKIIVVKIFLSCIP